MKERVLSSEEFRRLQLVELEVLSEVDRVCRKHNINYVIYGGTMLGAVRHKGFIPWDDDVDIAMLREDYIKFKSVLSDLNPDICFLQDHETDPDYRWGYTKIRRTGTSYIRLGQEHMKYKTGIFIDIMPMDDVPLSISGQILEYFICYLFRKILWSEAGKYSNTGFKRLWFKLINHIPANKVFNWLDRIVKKSRNDTPNKVRCLLLPAYGKPFVHNPITIRYGMPKEWFLKRAEYEFEGHKFWGTKDYDAIMKYSYNDYMKLPLENQREQHAPVSSIDFGNAPANR